MLQIVYNQDMLKNYYPLIAYLFSMGLSQFIKPFLHLKEDGFKLNHLFDSGGYPSSHTAGVVSLAMAVGFKDGFDSSLFALAAVLAVIVIFDSGHVRYHAGKNNKETIKLLKELDNKIIIDIKDYDIDLKEVLGHTTSEIIVGFIFGLMIAILFKIILKI